jgi:Lsr2
VAREVIVRIKDDFDQESIADTTVSFGYKGKVYEIDLTTEHDQEFDRAMAPFIKAGREVRPEKPRRSKSSAKKERPVEESPALAQKRRIRAWARQTGWHVIDRGAIRKDIVDAYAETHPDDPILAGTVPPRKRRASKPQTVTAQQLRAVSDTGEAAVTSLMNGKEPRLGLSKEERGEVRRWAIEQGLDQSPTGQIKGKVLDAYYAAHPTENEAHGK